MTSHDGRVGDFPIMMPVTAIEAIGAGGGSIAWLDDGVLKVGPRSAGARPGPACYGHGGTQPTVSDAYLLCGYLSEDAPLASGLRLRRDLSEAAIAPIAAVLERDATAAAEAIVAVASANMLANAAAVHRASRRLAGRTHADDLRRCRRDPRAVARRGDRHRSRHRPASLRGVVRVRRLVSDLLYDVVRNVHGTSPDDAAIAAIYDDLHAQGVAWLAQQAAGAAGVAEYHADIRYAGQSFDVGVVLAARPGRAALAAAFHAEHRRRYGHADPAARIEIIALRLRMRGALPGPGAVKLPPGGPEPIPRARKLRFGGAWYEAPVYRWGDLPVGWRGRGPAVVEQETATVVVPRGFSVTLGDFGDLTLQKEA